MYGRYNIQVGVIFELKKVLNSDKVKIEKNKEKGVFTVARTGINEQKCCFRKKIYLRAIIISLYARKCVCLFDNGKFISTERDGNRLIASLRTNELVRKIVVSLN